MSERKTDRVYGAIADSIREVALKGKPFTITDVPNGARSRRMFSLLVSQGEIRRRKPGYPGKRKTVYQLA